MNISLNSTIKPSIFETNSIFLNASDISLIEYSAFFGSIQIFQYLILNNVELKSSTWLYAIHSGNGEIIHLLESNEVLPPDNKYENLLIESIKCHHNNIAEYIENNLLPTNYNEINNTKILKKILKYHNYLRLPMDISGNEDFYYLFKLLCLLFY